VWNVRLHGGLRDFVFRPPQAENPSADEILSLAEEAIREEPGAAVSVQALRRLVQRSRTEKDGSTIAGEDDGSTTIAGDEDTSVPLLEPIARWAREAVLAAAGDDLEAARLQEFAGGLGLQEGTELSSFAWHGESVAVVPVSATDRSIELSYRPSPDERRRRDRIKNTYWKELAASRWWPWPEVEINADLIGFFADAEEGPLVADIRARAADAPGRYIFRFELGEAAAGFLVVKPLYRLARNLRVRARDPLRPARVRRAEERLSLPSPDLATLDSPDGTVTVLVHGLASTAAELAEMLSPLGLTLARFEHDTFVSIDDNATELAALLRTKADADRFILLCHSRGGLVARAAADLLDPSIAARLSIHTFGTPHRGTPLADLGRIVPLIHALDALRNPGDVLRAAHRYVLPRTWRTPEGIEEMSPDDAFITRMIHAPHRELEAFNSWGARYEDGRWWHRQFARACAGVLADPHDLVVSLTSSLEAGATQGPLDDPCTHFDYLGLPQVHDQLRSLV
jgi:pimeloyl-ACP methyl ester carboxylesterase